jgi:hypothetical protein
MAGKIDFDAAYERLSDEGECDIPGGLEYQRVLAEWKASGCPEDVEAFIIDRANALPGFDDTPTE